MKENDKKVVKSSMDIGSILFLIFLVLKLAEVGKVAQWSWWWVTAPLWLPITAVIISVAVFWFIKRIWDMFND